MDFKPANVDLQKTRQEAEMQYTARERHMIQKLEMIATGRSPGDDPALDLEIVRDIAADTLVDVGWPSVRHMKREAASSE